jgi:hypothetical protein
MLQNHIYERNHKMNLRVSVFGSTALHTASQYVYIIQRGRPRTCKLGKFPCIDVLPILAIQFILMLIFPCTFRVQLFKFNV